LFGEAPTSVPCDCPEGKCECNASLLVQVGHPDGDHCHSAGHRGVEADPRRALIEVNGDTATVTILEHAGERVAAG
jgi:hypothetical protein